MSTLLQCDATMKKWVEIKLSNVRLTLPGLAAAGFKKGDTMTVSGIPSEVETYLAGNLNGEVSIEQMDGDSIVVTGEQGLLWRLGNQHKNCKMDQHRRRTSGDL